jgi:predicted MFS family arabinose efflux permease
LTGRVRSATRATYLVFAVSGFGFASWASRIPQVKDRLGLDPSELGLLLLAIAAGSVSALPLSGTLVARWGSRRTVIAMATLSTAALLTVAFGYLAGVAPVAAGLFLFGVSAGIWDVAMNVQGAAVERRLGRSIMARFHAAWSLGTVVGALIGAGAVALHVPVTAHLAVAALLEGPVVWVVAREFVPDVADVVGEVDGEAGAQGEGGARGEARTGAEAGGTAGTGSALAAWREPRTLLIGLFVLAFAFAEGTGNDWIGVSVIENYRAPATLGTLVFAVFLAAMSGGRWFGVALLDRWGRVRVTRALAGLAVAGLLLFILGPALPAAFAGALLWGAGISLGFPTGMSAAADDPALAARRVGVTASIGYTAFLGGPPLIGFLGDHIEVRHALICVAALLALAVVIAGALRPPPGLEGLAGPPRRDAKVTLGPQEGAQSYHRAPCWGFGDAGDPASQREAEGPTPGFSPTSRPLRPEPMGTIGRRAQCS